MNQKTESPEMLERQIAETRAEIDVTLDAIQQKLSPGRILDQVFDYTKENGGAFAGNLGRSVRDNPVPMTLLGIGLGWLMFAGGRRDGYSRYDYSDRHGYGYAETGEEGYVNRGDAGASEPVEARESIGQKVSDMTGAGKAKARQWGDGAQHVSEAAGERYAAAKQRTAETAARMKDRAYRARDSAGHFIEENPMVVGALALAAGAALGALLPHTRREDHLMGSTADRLRDVARAQAQETAESAKQVASTAANATRTEPHTTSPGPATVATATRRERRSSSSEGSATPGAKIP